MMNLTGYNKTSNNLQALVPKIFPLKVQKRTKNFLKNLKEVERNMISETVETAYL